MKKKRAGCIGSQQNNISTNSLNNQAKDFFRLLILRLHQHQQVIRLTKQVTGEKKNDRSLASTPHKRLSSQKTRFKMICRQREEYEEALDQLGKSGGQGTSAADPEVGQPGQFLLGFTLTYFNRPISTLSKIERTKHYAVHRRWINKVDGFNSRKRKVPISQCTIVMWQI